MTLPTRLAKAAAAMRRLATAECPGVGRITALVDAGEPSAADPPPCRVCGGRHVRVIEEVVVEPAVALGGSGTTPGHLPGRGGVDLRADLRPDVSGFVRKMSG